MSEIEKLKEDYKDDIIAVSEERRKYRMITNSDGTVSFVDATEYQQRGTNYGAGDVNKTNIAINLINKYLSNLTVQKTSTQGGWVVEKYVNGWCKLYIKAQVYRASKEQTVYKLAFPDGMRLKNVRIQMTPAQNGWNVANFYHNTSGQTDDNAVISEAVIVFTAKDTTALTYCFDVCVSGFLV